MVNVELLEATMQHIEDNPQSHHQDTWFRKTDCGTSGCFAGWACMLAGVQPHFGTVEEPGFTWQGGTRSWHALVGGKPVLAAGIARNLLGLDEVDAAVLFSATNTRNQLRLMVKDLANGERLRDGYEYEE